MTQYYLKRQDTPIGIIDLDKLSFKLLDCYKGECLPMILYPYGTNKDYIPSEDDVTRFIIDRAFDDNYQGKDIILDSLGWDAVDYVKLIELTRGVRPTDSYWLCGLNEDYKFDDVHIRGRNCNTIFFKEVNCK